MSGSTKFVDDTNIFRRVQTRQGYDILQEDLNRLVQWQMLFNENKCN